MKISIQIYHIIGLNGLHHLSELKLSNNNIKSLSSLKSLPSIKELDISYNQLKTLDGIQNLLTLEVLNCNHNLIVEVNFNILYNSVNKKMLSTTNATTTTKSNNNNIISMKGMELPNLTICLNELYIANNRVRSMEGIVHLKDSIDTIDINSNNITVASGNMK